MSARITSYNVCYTKLLRDDWVEVEVVDLHQAEGATQVVPAGIEDLVAQIYDHIHYVGVRFDLVPGAVRAEDSQRVVTVITSYSIHYTKLYEKDVDPAE